MIKNNIDCSIVICAVGNYFKIEQELFQTIMQYNEIPSNLEILVVCDGPFWDTTPLIQSLKYKKWFRVIYLDIHSDHLGILFNVALKEARGKYITFMWPGVNYPISSIQETCNLLDNEPDVDCIYKITIEGGIDSNYNSLINYGWLQCENLIALQGAIFKTEKILNLGFNEQMEKQRIVGWDLFLRFSKLNKIKLDVESKPTFIWNIEDFPYTQFKPISYNDLHRSLTKKNNNNDAKIKVTVTGGYWEPTHNQLCFYNYFDTEKGQEDFSWKSLFDFSTNQEDLEDSDLVIISRGRHQNVLKILDYCEKKKIPTLYMIDDNWFTVADDWPVYKTIFSPGMPDYEVFLECLRRCNAVLLYSSVLEKYVEKYAKKIFRIDINIDLDLFKQYNQVNRERLLIGYSGSLRYSEVAFEGLMKYVKKNNNCDILIFGTEIPNQLKELKGTDRLKYIQYTNYHNYAKKIAEIRPDILLAPLDDCESSKSKCPNKFLEITGAGAVGIYSNLTPYSDIVINDENGILISSVSQEDPEEWFQSIEQLANDDEKRKCIYNNAYNLVKQKYETTSCYNKFSDVLVSVLKEERK
jgi:glycosyltransferase involved in cell wall biosynthesis